MILTIHSDYLIGFSNVNTSCPYEVGTESVYIMQIHFSHQTVPVLPGKACLASGQGHLLWSMLRYETIIKINIGLQEQELWYIDCVWPMDLTLTLSGPYRATFVANYKNTQWFIPKIKKHTYVGESESTPLPGYNAVVYTAGLSCSPCLWTRFWEKYKSIVVWERIC
jgi:hypothetical protein